MSQVVLVGTDDGYSTLYVNDKLEMEGHLNSCEILRCLAKKRRRIDSFEDLYANEQWLEHWNVFPVNLDDVVIAGQEWKP